MAYIINRLVILNLLFFIFVAAGTTLAAATVTYNFTETNLEFKINFDKGYSNVNDYNTTSEKIITFDTTEQVVFEKLDFFDIPVVSMWLTSDGTRKKLFFEFENNKIIEPVIRKQAKTLIIDFTIPELEKPQAPSALPGLGAYLRMFFGLAVIAGIIFGGIFILKVLFKHNLVTDIPGVGRLLGKVNLDTKKQLIFYELGDYIYIIGSTEGGINVIDKISDQDEITIIKSGFARKKDFSSYMKIFTKKNELAEDLENSSENIREKISSLRKK